MEKQTSSGPLSGYRVLDLAQPIGLHCTKLLADMGADVVKIERPGGDPCRLLPPYKDDLPHPEQSLYFLHFNTNKRGITLSLATAEGAEIFVRLAERADIVIETFPPGYMEKLGLGYGRLKEKNLGIIMASITPFGQTGPYRDFKATDIAALAMGTTMAVSGEPGEPPVTAPGELAYGMASTYAAFGIAAALYDRLESGTGQYIDVSMHECSAHLAGYAIPHYSYDGTKPFRTSRRGTVPDLYDVYPVKDGYIRLTNITGVQWEHLVAWMGSPEILADPLFEGLEYRRANMDLLHDIIADFCLEHTKQEMYEEGQRRHVVVSPVNSAVEFVESTQTRARGIFIEMEHPLIGKYPQFGPVPRLSDTPGGVTRPAPIVGQHNGEIYCNELGFSREALTALAAAGVI